MNDRPTLGDLAAEATGPLECKACGCRHFDKRILREGTAIRRIRYCRNCGRPTVVTPDPADLPAPSTAPSE